MVTNTVHFEIVIDLSSSALIAKLKRFFVRRGKSETIFSENATNFKEAFSKLMTLFKFSEKNSEISNFLSWKAIDL